MRKFYKTIYRVEVLSEGAAPYCETLSDLDYIITDGDCSGTFTEEDSIELTPKEMAEEVLAQGSDTEFFRLDENGNDLI